jgi:hypothetical protein
MAAQKRGNDMFNDLFFLFGSKQMGVADVSLEITHLPRANSMNSPLVNPENVAKLAHSPLLLKFIAEYTHQCEKLKIPSWRRNFAEAASHASSVASRRDIRI